MSKEKRLLFVDGDKYEWEKDTITGAELRVLAAIPQNVQIYLKVPSKPDEPISDQTSTDLVNRHGGPARFSTQSPGSQAG
jgi:predicted component of type VI protein secretion system